MVNDTMDNNIKFVKMLHLKRLALFQVPICNLHLELSAIESHNFGAMFPADLTNLNINTVMSVMSDLPGFFPFCIHFDWGLWRIILTYGKLITRRLLV